MDPLFHAGCYYVQDSSAMVVGHMVREFLDRFDGLGRPVRVLDLCAAPGGKTTDLAASLRERFGDGFLLVANEVMRNRASILCDNVAVWGDPNVVVTSCDPKAFERLEGFFDIVVTDVPCSGEGMFRKDPKAVEDWSPDAVSLCSARQKRILADVWPSLRQGGLLVYSTCTFEEAENDANVGWAASELGAEVLEYAYWSSHSRSIRGYPGSPIPMKRQPSASSLSSSMAAESYALMDISEAYLILEYAPRASEMSFPVCRNTSEAPPKSSTRPAPTFGSNPKILLSAHRHTRSSLMFSIVHDSCLKFSKEQYQITSIASPYGPNL